MAQGRSASCAVEAHRKPPQAIIEGVYPTTEACHAVKVRTEGADAERELLVLAYDDPDTGNNQGARATMTNGLARKVPHEVSSNIHEAHSRGPRFQSLLRGNSKHVRICLDAGTSKRILLDNNE